MLSLSNTLDIAISIRTATARLTNTILGSDDQNHAETLRTIASEIGLCNIAYTRVSSDKHGDAFSVFSIVTYSRSWQRQYSLRKYLACDPTISYGRKTDEPFDWTCLPADDPATRAFLIDAVDHGVGQNGFSVPLRGRRGVLSLVSFNGDMPKNEWEAYIAANINSLKLLAVLIDAASHVNFTLPSPQVHLSNREEQCLLWAARGKTYQEIAAIQGLSFGTVKVYLDAARHKLQCMNLTHAAAVAFATGIFPAQAL
jgi:DNA-binding CsgD family transcriptional regulator